MMAGEMDAESSAKGLLANIKFPQFERVGINANSDGTLSYPLTGRMPAPGIGRTASLYYLPVGCVQYLRGRSQSF
jgi:hypothetical protein